MSALCVAPMAQHGRVPQTPTWHGLDDTVPRQKLSPVTPTAGEPQQGGKSPMIEKEETVAVAPTWATLIDPEWIDELDKTAFLVRCREGVVSFVELRTFILQHYYYSRHFTRYVCALLSNLEGEADRLALVGNLVEELGLGEGGHVPHAQIYRNLMQRFGVKPGDAPVLPSTAFLVDCMFVSCRDPDALVGLGALCLGTEAIVPHIYSQVVQGFRAHDIAEPTLEFFHIHIAGDDMHALTMKQIIDHELAGNAVKASVLQNSARKAVYARKVFFEGLHRSSRLTPMQRNASHDDL